MVDFTNIHEVILFFDEVLDIKESEDYTTHSEYNGKFYHTESGEKYWVTQKNQFYFTYGNKFEDEDHDKGETIDKEVLHMILDKDVDLILYGYPGGKIKSIDPSNVKSYADKNGTDFVRGSDGVEAYAFPIDKLNRCGDDFIENKDGKIQNVTLKVFKDKLKEDKKLLIDFKDSEEKTMESENIEHRHRIDMFQYTNNGEEFWFEIDDIEGMRLYKERKED